MMSYFHRKVWFGFLTAIFIISWLAITSYRNNKKSEETASWVSHTNLVMYHAEQLLTLTIDMESGQRGYSLTGNEQFLEPTRQASEVILGHTQSLKDITADNSSQQVRIDKLEQVVRQKLDFTLHVVEIRKKYGLDSAMALNASMLGKNLMDTIRAHVKGIQAEEGKLLESRTELSQQGIDRFKTTFFSMLAMTLFILVLLFYFIYINLKAREEAEKNLRHSLDEVQDLYDNAPCGYHSVNSEGLIMEVNHTWLDWLKLRREDVVGIRKLDSFLTEESGIKYRNTFETFKKTGLVKDEEFQVQRSDGSVFFILLNSTGAFDENHHLIRSRSMVIDYTDQKNAHQKIEQLNHELESFSYSVSHDLRAPLRSIAGYTQILMEDYATNFDDEGRRVLNVVVANAKRMGQLIDDLLDFSRISRKDIVQSSVNTKGLVDSVINELQSQESNRKIDFKIAELQPCHGDSNLLRQVWFNLISNAMKYTRKKEMALVEISSEKRNYEIVYKVKDNGTGFDMQYVHKLFGVFQRLHRHKDFEGTGVGLAIVQRIINRHGGRVWAEGEVEKGAVFYFTLPYDPS